MIEYVVRAASQEQAIEVEAQIRAAAKRHYRGTVRRDHHFLLADTLREANKVAELLKSPVACRAMTSWGCSNDHGVVEAYFHATAEGKTPLEAERALLEDLPILAAARVMSLGAEIRGHFRDWVRAIRGLYAA